MIAVTQPSVQNKIHPHKFALWLGIASIIMLFAALTSAFIVRSAAAEWIEFKLPGIFLFTTVIILMSSATMHWAYISHKRYNYTNFKIATALTFLLGLAFIVGQYEGWFKLAAIGMFLDGNPSGSFVYVISFVHLIHIVGGLVALAVLFVRSLIRPFHPRQLLGIELTTTYWHFVDILWIYLYLFFVIKFS